MSEKEDESMNRILEYGLVALVIGLVILGTGFNFPAYETLAWPAFEAIDWSLLAGLPLP